MDCNSEKCVVVMAEGLPLGLAANTAAILGITLGKAKAEAVGSDVVDRSGRSHLGIIEFPVPVLRSSPEQLRTLREALYQPDFQDLTVVDFSDLAQECRSYDEFIERMARSAERDLNYLGLAICGEKKKVNRLTGSLPLLR